MKHLLLCSLLFLGIQFGFGQYDLTASLFELEDVLFERIPVPNGAKEAYKLLIKQPLDHENPEKGHFYQTVWLTHRGFERPNLMITNGYYAKSNRQSELALMIDANQFSVEHRYFGDSSPDSLDWRYLNLKQVTADLHKVRTLMGRMYKKAWISSGISKGGQTTIFYRYFYPDDVQASVPYVAPLNLEFEDKRIYSFLDTVGTESCREAILDFQIRMLKNEKKILPYLKWYAKGKGIAFKRLGMAEAFELTVLEYPFSFWQWGADCAEIPSKDASLEDQLSYLLEVIDISFFGDSDIDYYASHYYQAASEMGYYGYETGPFAKYLKALSPKPNPHAAFSPIEIEKEFDPSLMKKVDVWLKENGDEFLYIYGGKDTWSATRVTPAEGRDAISFILEGKHHGTARIRNFSPEQLQLFVEKLELWLDMELD
ncbi:MAG: S28 family serine protease [Bacteroidota bacterium]